MATGPTINGELNTQVVQAADQLAGFIGLKLAPVFGAETRAGEYPFFSIAGAQLMKNFKTERNEDGSYPEVRRANETRLYGCQDRGLEERVDDAKAKDMARFFNAQANAARMTVQNVLLGHENRVASLVQNTSNFASTAAISAYTVANLAVVDFAADVQARIHAMQDAGSIPDTIVLNSRLAGYVGRTTKFQNFVKGIGLFSQGAGTFIITKDVIMNAFAELGIRKVYIPFGGVDASKSRTATNISPIWSSDYIWVGKSADAENQLSVVEEGATDFGVDPYDAMGGALRTFVWNEEGGVFVTETYRSEKRRSEMVRVRQNTDERVIDENAGRLIATSFA